MCNRFYTGAILSFLQLKTFHLSFKELFLIHGALVFQGLQPHEVGKL